MLHVHQQSIHQARTSAATVQHLSVGPLARSVQVRHLHKIFEAGVPGCLARVCALQNVHLDVRSGEMVAVEGHAGAGKSTLLLLLAGILQADRGAVEWKTDTGERLRNPHGVEYLPAWRPGHAVRSLRRAVASSPGILLVDDICANLDAASRSEVRYLVQRLRASRVSIVMVVGGDRAVRALASRVVLLRAGRLYANVQ